MKWFVILSLLLIGISLLIYSFVNYYQEKKLGLMHKFGFFVLSILLLIITVGYIFIFLSCLPNETY